MLYEPEELTISTIKFSGAIKDTTTVTVPWAVEPSRAVPVIIASYVPSA